jgi:hypothetical protein
MFLPLGSGFAPEFRRWCKRHGAIDIAQAGECSVGSLLLQHECNVRETFAQRSCCAQLQMQGNNLITEMF